MLRAHGCDERAVYWCTQYVRLSVFAYKSNSLLLASLTPLLSYVFQAAGLNETHANIATTSIVLGASVALNSLAWCEIPFVMGASIASSIVGGKIEQLAYHYAKRHNFFAEERQRVQQNLEPLFNSLVCGKR